MEGGAEAQLFKLLSPNTGRDLLRRPTRSYRKDEEKEAETNTRSSRGLENQQPRPVPLRSPVEHADTWVCLVRQVEGVTGRFLTSAFRVAEEEGGGEGVAVLVLGGDLLRCVSCFPVDPPPFCLPTFSSWIWVSAVPWARPKSTRANLQQTQVTHVTCATSCVSRQLPVNKTLFRRTSPPSGLTVVLQELSKFHQLWGEESRGARGDQSEASD